MDLHRADLNLEGNQASIDVPSRMFNATQWPHLVQLYDEIGVEHESVASSQSFTRISPGDRRVDTYLAIDVAFRPDLALRQLLSPGARRILSEAQTLMRNGRRDLDAGVDPQTTIGQYLSDRGYSSSFAREFLYATLSSTVCTCSYQHLQRYPATIILQALRNLTDDRSLLRTRHGTRDVVDRLTCQLDDVRTSAHVAKVIQGRDNAIVLHP